MVREFSSPTSFWRLCRGVHYTNLVREAENLCIKFLAPLPGSKQRKENNKATVGVCVVNICDFSIFESFFLLISFCTNLLFYF